LLTPKTKNEAEASNMLLKSLLAAPVTIACRPKLKEINCRIVKDHSSLRAASKSTRSERAKSSNLYAEVNASVRKKLESAKFAGKNAKKFFDGIL